MARGRSVTQGRQAAGRRRHRPAPARPHVLHGHPELGAGGTRTVGAVTAPCPIPPADLRGFGARRRRINERTALTRQVHLGMPAIGSAR